MTSEDKTGPTGHLGKPREKMTNPDPSYLTHLIIKKDKEGIREYTKWAKEHTKKLRQLEREANGEQVPGDYDGGY